jgi:hypothetical protein
MYERRRQRRGCSGHDWVNRTTTQRRRARGRYGLARTPWRFQLGHTRPAVNAATNRAARPVAEPDRWSPGRAGALTVPGAGLPGRVGSFGRNELMLCVTG